MKDTIGLILNEYINLVHKLNLSFNCLQANHSTTNYHTAGYKCYKKHHTLWYKVECTINQEYSVACITVKMSNHVLLFTILINFQ
jgi:hypothetical protein